MHGHCVPVFVSEGGVGRSAGLQPKEGVALQMLGHGRDKLMLKILNRRFTRPVPAK